MLNTTENLPPSEFPPLHRIQPEPPKTFNWLILVITLIAIFLFSAFLIQKAFFTNPEDSENSPTPSTLSEQNSPVLPSITPTPSFQLYTNYKFNFSIRYPKTWKVTESENQNTINFYGNTSNKDTTDNEPSCTIVIALVENNDLLLNAVKKQYPALNTEELKQTTIASKLGAYESTTSIEHTFFTKVTTALYKLACNTKTNNGSEKNDAETILSSFAPVAIPTTTAATTTVPKT
ncbi:MAG: hypothetical protein WCP97_05345 [bacterium]